MPLARIFSSLSSLPSIQTSALLQEKVEKINGIEGRQSEGDFNPKGAGVLSVSRQNLHPPSKKEKSPTPQSLAKRDAEKNAQKRKRKKHHPSLPSSNRTIPHRRCLHLLKRLALKTLMTSLAAPNRLPPHRSISRGRRRLLLLRGSRALGAHGPRARERVAAAGAPDVDRASGGQFGSDGGFGGDLLSRKKRSA